MNCSFQTVAGARSAGFGARKTKQITNENMFEVIMTKHFLERNIRLNGFLVLNNLDIKETQISVVAFKNINDKENSQNIDRNWIS